MAGEHITSHCTQYVLVGAVRILGPAAGPGRAPDLPLDRADRHVIVKVVEGARPHRGADGGAALID